LRILKKEACLTYSAVTKDTRNADIGVFTEPSTLKCNENGCKSDVQKQAAGQAKQPGYSGSRQRIDAANSMLIKIPDSSIVTDTLCRLDCIASDTDGHAGRDANGGDVVVEQIGDIAAGVYMLGHRAVPIYLVDGERPALFDAGMTALGPHYGEQLRQVLDGRQPAWCFLTHSHWDHCGAVAHLKSQFPEMKVVCSRKAADVFARPHAIAMITDLNRSTTEMVTDWGIEAQANPFEPFSVDVIAGDGDCFDVSPDLSVHVMETPGHTWDFLSYFIPQRKLLMASEAVGTPDQTGTIINDCLADYDAYLRSMQRLDALDVEILLLGHVCSLTGEDARRHTAACIGQLRRFKATVERLLMEEEGNLDALKKRIKAQEWDDHPGIRQPELAYRLNLDARIKRIIQKNQSTGKIQELP
jgi:glyoxylase-like metal-dependent hydrolase (beta-lactamase superfamily II)